MPISPDEAFKHETAEEKDAFEKFVSIIDKELREKFQGYSVKVTLPKHAGFTVRVVERLRKAYEAAGWAEIHMSCTSTVAEFFKNKRPSCGSAWD